MGTPVSASSTVVSATFTRPADTTAYSVGDLVANSTTAASVVPMAFTPGADISRGFSVRRARVSASNTSTTNASFRVHLYQTDPSASTGIANGDNGAWSTKVAGYMGSLDVTIDKAFTDAAKGVGVPLIGGEVTGTPAAGALTVYALLEARAAYTPTSAQTFTVELEVFQG